MTAFWPGCGCCDPPVCEILFDTFTFGTAWTVVSGSWSFTSKATSSTNGATLVSVLTEADNHQFLLCNVKATAANQVAEFLIVNDSAATAGVVLRVTFGDSSVSGDCGSAQLFEDGVALDDAQPMYGLVDGLPFYITICVDASLNRVLALVVPGDADISNWYDVSRVTLGASYLALSGILTTANGSHVGVRVVTANSANIEFTDLNWQRLWNEGGSSCANCSPCIPGPDRTYSSSDTYIDLAKRWPAINGEVSTCEYTVTGTAPDVTQVVSNLTISDYDRERGYGIRVEGLLSSSGVTSLFIDNGHHELRITTTVNLATFKIDFKVELFKDAVLLDTTATQAWGNIATTVSFTALLGMCNDRVFGWVEGFTNQFVVYPLVESATTQVADGHLCWASAGTAGSGTNVARIDELIVTRCPGCDHCDHCETVTEDVRMSVLVAVGDAYWDGTHVLDAATCDYGGTGKVRLRPSHNAITVDLYDIAVSPHVLKSTGMLTFTRPLPCDSFVDEVVTVNGTVSGTATVTSV